MEIKLALLNDYDIVVNGLAELLRPFPDFRVVEMEVGRVAVEQPVDIALFDTYGRVGMPWSSSTRSVDCPLVAHAVVFTFDFGNPLVERAAASACTAICGRGCPRNVSLNRCAASQEVKSSCPHREPRSATGSFVSLAVRRSRVVGTRSEVLALLSEGLSNQQIADALYLNVETVRSHLKQVYAKLGVHTRTQATARALRDPAFQHR